MKNLTLTVIRLNATNELTESKPCYHCIMSLKKSGFIKKVIYSTINGDCNIENINIINNNHISRGNYT